ncbi:MAG TPA: dihydrolipoamide acetyltransferase family protein [bacterium]|nr:dihydrolipoamide acetyltransferase family protein [bacterium]
MPTPVILPKFDMMMEEGTIVRWLRAEGDAVREGEPVVEVMTDKVNMEVEAPASGLLAAIRAQEGERVPVTGIIAYVVQPGESVPAAGAAGVSTGATPIARRLAKEAGLEISALRGTGPGGRVTDEDVRRALAEQPVRGEPLSPRRRAIAERVTRSAREIPHVYLMRDVDVSGIAARKGAVSYTAVVVRAAARALRAHPRMRASFGEGAVQVRAALHIGVAVDTDQGLLVPVVKDADRKEAAAIHGEIEALAARARAGTLTLADVSDGVFTVSNLGMFGVDRFTSLIFPPQSAILSVGAVRPRPWADGDAVVVRRVCTLTLAVDHRVADGAAGARFLDDLVREMGAP